MEITKLLISASSGAVIGYITNWLAIKMLFKPQTEKRIAGVKIPFTPGLIPKEKERIAESIGSSVGEYLLTKETMVESLCNDDMVNTFRSWIENKIEELHDSDDSIEEFLKKILDDKYDEFNDYAMNGINKFIIQTINNPKTLNDMDDFIIEKIDDILNTGVREFLEYDIIKNLRDSIRDRIKEYKNSEQTQTYIRSYLNNELKNSIESQKKISDIVPSEAIEAIKTLIYENREGICKGLANIIEEPSVEEKIKNAISNIIGSKLSPMIAMFIKPDIIYDLIVSGINGYLENEESQEEVIELVNEKIDFIIAMNIEDILKKVGTDNCDKIVNNISTVLTNNVVKDEIIDNVFNNGILSLQKFETLKGVIMSFDENMVEYISENLLGFIHDTLRKESTEKFINDTSQKVIKAIIGKRLKDILPQDKEKVKSALSNFVVDIYIKLINNKAGDAIELLNISKIIETKIKGFDTDYLEKLILDITNKELKAITWLGALLGFFMGISTYFISL